MKIFYNSVLILFLVVLILFKNKTKDYKNYIIVILLICIILIIFKRKALKCKVIKNKRRLQLSQINIEVCLENLSIIHDIFQKHGIFFWLSEGTALGFTRNGTIIEWDDDVDIGIWIEDKEKLENAIPEIIENGFEICQNSLNETFWCFLRKGERLDIDITGKDLPCMANDYGESCNNLIPFLQSFNKIKIQGKTYNLPKEPYLENKYGKNWKIPKQIKTGRKLHHRYLEE